MHIRAPAVCLPSAPQHTQPTCATAAKKSSVGAWGAIAGSTPVLPTSTITRLDKTVIDDGKAAH